MSKIIELPEILANQIAAGEVVERPASVVKELVENAIDAKSSQITIDIEESGLKMIEITDNGEGMSSEDLPLSLRRHATSKIKTQSDLFRIRTLGFRGEALPSVASISKITIKTATKEAAYGSLLIATGGEIETLEETPTPVGTKIKVENLFYNTPARLKYMKSLQAELAHIVDVVNRLSLAHPEIAFTLISDGRQLTQTSGTGDLRQAIAGIYGLNTAKKMIPISSADLDFEVSGYVSLPELTRANRNYMTILVNGRYIKNFLLNRAILDGYGSKLMVGRFPIVVIDIQIDPYLADVNVHPTKQEVRISKERELMALISTAISESLKEQDLIPDALESLAKSSTRHFSKPEQTQLPLQSKGLYYDPQKNDFFVKESDVSEKLPESNFHDTEIDKTVKDQRTEQFPDLGENTGFSSVKRASRSQDEVTDADHPGFDLKNKQKLSQMLTRLENEERSVFPELDYFGQMHGTYLFAQGKDGLFIIDQHAAQERVKYEYYRDKIGEVDSSLQQLLVPYLFEFSGSDFINLQEKMALLNEVGIFLEVYGHNTFILREHPIWMKEEEIASGVYEMCDMLLLTNEVSIKTYRAELAIMMSCKRSIKANHSLDDYSARNLLLQLAQCQNPYNCPHGRPVLINFSKADMEKMFRRIQENHTSLRELGKY
ncbi:DNA mismatch repair endonuclease MutL [Streptococcus dysgalactiae]|uniref:DNA mismatch repair endonuclease MutL n=1 Tax=Streptococcus dysgalactiae TaxID=1334 RepID=UPI001CF30E27|nr:DNA mismatch repair endonuclease MutL [Streptococcus dysgalactiae]MCB2831025.1 DNA mismatch repair endonuclease MutL [Streptococcus dysgalactiae subsp. dysgalactiae]MCB2835192.1 DNA mismatch repair endonuclease MutL [Streptococcus dysgalactiae subsp. dysgalactiae]MCB2836784.1 DNA mismatch repair endonuclease MutL [Streptococcus dysgalactiae subsp. dysgalactiae]MCB2838766.1 DNA mismatch repair endonuclease MutL [Streptococcus dysgalactiae subsp. dysgalactiae]MCB2848598.1 DNA mismatch repair 